MASNYRPYFDSHSPFSSRYLNAWIEIFTDERMKQPRQPFSVPEPGFEPGEQFPFAEGIVTITDRTTHCHYALGYMHSYHLTWESSNGSEQRERHIRESQLKRDDQAIYFAPTQQQLRQHIRATNPCSSC